jgi:hypothetical protein
MEHLSLQELYKGNLEGGLLYRRALKDIQRKSVDMGISLHRGPMGNLEGRFICLVLRETEKRAPETQHLCLWRLCKGNLEGGVLYWGP